MRDEEKQTAAVQIMGALHGVGTVAGMSEAEIADVATLAALWLQADVHGPVGGLAVVQGIIDQAGPGLRQRLG